VSAPVIVARARRLLVAIAPAIALAAAVRGARAEPAGPPAPPAAAGEARREGIRVPIRPDDPARGEPTAPVTVVMFADFPCASCARAAAELKAVEAAFPGQLRVVWKHLPVSFHPYAREAAHAAESARAQGKFWPMHDALFGHPQALAPAELEACAQEVGLDVARFRAAASSPDVHERVQEDAVEAGAAGVTGVPSFVVGGELVAGWAGLRPAVERTLQRARR
jgi:protein-disulfide isomerase